MKEVVVVVLVCNRDVLLKASSPYGPNHLVLGLGHYIPNICNIPIDNRSDLTVQTSSLIRSI